jgi:hypothetical protein
MIESFDQGLLLRVECLATDNRVFKFQVEPRLVHYRPREVDVQIDSHAAFFTGFDWP